MQDERIVYEGNLEKVIRKFIRLYDGRLREFLSYYNGTLNEQEVKYLSGNGSAVCDMNDRVVEKVRYGKDVYLSCVRSSTHVFK